MDYLSNNDHRITLDEAIRITKNYRNSVGENDFKAGFVEGEALKDVLDQDGCIGLRIYFAKSDTGNMEVVLVGVDSEGEDLYEGILLEKLPPCPPYCGSSSPLLSG